MDGPNDFNSKQGKGITAMIRMAILFSAFLAIILLGITGCIPGTNLSNGAYSFFETNKNEEILYSTFNKNMPYGNTGKITKDSSSYDYYTEYVETSLYNMKILAVGLALFILILIAAFYTNIRAKKKYIKKASELTDIMKNMLNNIDSMVYVTIPDTGEILFMNDSMKQHYGIKDDVIGKICYEVLQAGMTEKCEFCPCYQLDKAPDKIIVWNENSSLTKRAYRNTDRYIDWPGQKKVHLQHSVDVTELTAAKELAEHTSCSKSDFLAKMSHEIRTPMNAIIGIAQIQLQDENLPNQYAAALEQIHNSGSSLLGIINDILDMSKIEIGKMELNPADYDVPSLINDTVLLNIMRIGSKPLVFMLNLNENLPLKLYGDELRIKQILNNLLSNAIKYTGGGHVKLSITHTEQNEDILLHFTVEDTGQGMKSEDVEKLFTKFERFNTSANKYIEGTGLGLSIVKYFVEQMGGTIEVKSEYRRGSVFTVTIKQKAIQCEAIGTEIAEKLKNFTFAARLGERKTRVREIMPYGKVLIVDDVESNLYVAKGLMVPYQLQITTVNSGYMVMDKIFKEGNVYDIIFMDHMMPEMDGMETTKKLRELGYKGAIVALTANALVGNAEMFTRGGFDDFISKPIDVRHLDAVLNQYVRNMHPQEAQQYKTAIINADADVSEISSELLETSCSDVAQAAVKLREAAAAGNIKLFTTVAHGIKSVLMNIGENDLSAVALNLEKAGATGDIDYINANTEKFAKSLEILNRRLRAADGDGNMDMADISEDTDYLMEQLSAIKAACDDYDDAAAYAALDLLKEKSWKNETVALLEEIRMILFFHSDFEGVTERIRKILK